MANYPTIPITLPMARRGKDYAVQRNQAEMGYEQTRATVTRAPRIWAFSHNYCTDAERATWEAFWDARKGGGESFQFTDPVTSTTVTVRFLMDEPDITRTAAFKRWNINVTLKEAL